MSKNLRILLDESVPDDLANLLSRHEALNTEYVRHMPSLKGREDHVLMRYAREKNRILVTVELGINEKSFPICTHPGIIILASRSRHSDISAEVFQKFIASGHRARAKHAVTYLRQGSARILEADTEKIVQI